MDAIGRGEYVDTGGKLILLCVLSWDLPKYDVLITCVSGARILFCSCPRTYVLCSNVSPLIYNLRLIILIRAEIFQTQGKENVATFSRRLILQLYFFEMTTTTVRTARNER